MSRMRRRRRLVRVTPGSARPGLVTHDLNYLRGIAALCGAYDLPITIVSDGLDRIATAMVARAGLKIPVFANHLEWLGGRRWRLGFPHTRTDCRATAGHCKCATITAASAALHVMIGDGRSDFCAAAGADLVIAKDSLAAHCARSVLLASTISCCLFPWSRWG